MFNCKFCSKELKDNNGLLNHQHRCKDNPNAIANKFTSETAKTASSGKNFAGLIKFNKAKKQPDADVFVENSTLARHNLKNRIIKQNLLEYKCVCCDNAGLHNGKPLVLQLDHINGVNNDHRLENLRFLCPNCHTQQDTYAAKNIVRQKNITV